MNILFVCGGGLVGGKEKQTLDYMLEMKRRGHNVSCAISSWSSGDFPKLLTDNSIPFRKIRLGFISLSLSLENIRMTLHQLMYVPSLYSNYRKLLKEWKPDVIIHTNFHHVLLLLPLMKSTTNVFHVHDVLSASGKFKWLFRQFNKKIKVFIGVSKFICNNIAQLDIPAEKIKLIYNGINVPPISPRANNSVPVIGIVGQVGAWKGHGVMIDAIQSLQDLSWKLYIIGFGDESYISQLKEKILRAGLTERVDFKGRRFGLNEIYADVDISCAPSLFEEPFGLSAAEPSFFEIPVVVSNRGGLPEIVVDNQTGFVVQADNAGQLASALRTLLEDPQKRRQFGVAAKQRVERLFRIENSATELEKLLREISPFKFMWP